MLKPILVAAALFAASSAEAAVVTLDFEGLSSVYPYRGGDPVFLQDFYNGGTSSDGTRGANYGVTFSDNAEGLCLNSMTVICSNTSRGGLGDPASQGEALFYRTGEELVINVAGGFTSLAFQHANVNIFRTVRVFDEVGGAGNRIAFTFFPESGSACPGFNAAFCPFGAFSVPFTGIARSVTFRGGGNDLVLDDLTLDLVALPGAGAGAVPEPATWAMLILGFGLLGAAVRRHRPALVASA